MTRVKTPLINNVMKEHIERIRKRRKETKPYRIEAIVMGKVEITLRAKNRQGASKAGRKDLLTPNPETDYLELKKVIITKITEEKESSSKWISPKEIMGGDDD